MSFAEPTFLLGLLLVPLALLLLWASRRRARRYAVRFPAAATLAAAAGNVPTWRRVLPTLLALLAVVSLVLALAKPERTVAVAIERSSIVLVSDHSRSMLAQDIDPDRMTAAKRAARSFLDDLPDEVRVGAVAFSDFPDAVQTPSENHEDARAVIDGQVADGGTATGEALKSAVDMLRRERGGPEGRPPAAIVLLSDGKTTLGRNPVEVAAEAKRLRIPIFTISLGTEDATVPNPSFGPPLPATPDPETLQRIARTSGGRAYAAEDENELSEIYRALGTTLGKREEQREMTPAFAAGGLLLLLGAVAGSVRWAGRLP